MTDVRTQSSGIADQVMRTVNQLRTGPGMGIMGFPIWKLVVLQDIMLFTLLGIGLVWYPSTVVSVQAKMAGFVGWPPASWLTKSDTISLLLSVIGVLALGFNIPLLACLVNNDMGFASSLAGYHIVNAALMYMSALTHGHTYRVLIPFALHNLIGAAGLFLTLPGGYSKLLNNLGITKIHVA